MRKLVVVAANDYETLLSVTKAFELGIAKPILVGDKEKILHISNKYSLKIDVFKIVDIKDLEECAKESVKLVRCKEADFIMKGLIDTSILLKAVLDKKSGLRCDKLLSHIMVYKIKNYHKFLLLTDGGMNVCPNVAEKIEIIKNALKVCESLNIENIKVACLAATEKVNSKMVATIEAEQLKTMGINGEFGSDIYIDGPISFDLAVSKDAAYIKNYKSKVAGNADLLLVPNIEVGNAIGKSLTIFGEAKQGGIIMGAKVPIVLVSRSDSNESKLNSIALGSLVLNS